MELENPRGHNALFKRGKPGTSRKTNFLFFTTAWACLFSLFYTTYINAQTCVTSNVNHFTADARRPYRISTVNLGGLSGVSSVEAARAIVASSFTWNEQANARPFVYAGGSGNTDLPSTLSACNSAGIDYSLVMVDTTTNTGSKGRAVGRCTNASGQATQFIIYVNANTASGALRSWETNGTTIGASEFDLLQTVTHEFGHTLRLGHPGSGDYGTMTPTTQGHSRQRDLYRYDIGCSNQIAGERSTTARRHLVSGGSIGAETSYLGTWDIAKVSAGLTWINGSAAWASAAKFPSCLFWEPGHSTTDAMCLPTAETNRHLIGSFTEATFREDTTQDRIFWVSYDEYPTNGTSSADHRVRYRRSSDGFSTSNFGTLNECNSMSGFMTCSSQSPINTGKAPAVAWDTYTDRSIFVWAHQNRDDSTASRQVRVAVGYIPEYRLPTADTLDVQSTVPPGVACQSFSANGYDCMVATVPQTDSMFNIEIHRFWASTGSDRYHLQVDSSPTQLTATSTGGRIAAWYHDGYFWIAYREIFAGNNLAVYRSTDTVTWESVASPGYSDIGPSAVSYWAGTNNVLLYTE